MKNINMKNISIKIINVKNIDINFKLKYIQIQLQILQLFKKFKSICYHIYTLIFNIIIINMYIFILFKLKVKLVNLIKFCNVFPIFHVSFSVILFLKLNYIII